MQRHDGNHPSFGKIRKLLDAERPGNYTIRGGYGLDGAEA